RGTTAPTNATRWVRKHGTDETRTCDVQLERLTKGPQVTRSAPLCHLSIFDRSSGHAAVSKRSSRCQARERFGQVREDVIRAGLLELADAVLPRRNADTHRVGGVRCGDIQ